MDIQQIIENYSSLKNLSTFDNADYYLKLCRKAFVENPEFRQKFDEEEPQVKNLNGIYYVQFKKFRLGPIIRKPDFKDGFSIVTLKDNLKFCVDINGDILIDPVKIVSLQELKLVSSLAPRSFLKYLSLNTVKQYIKNSNDYEIFDCWSEAKRNAISKTKKEDEM